MKPSELLDGILRLTVIVSRHSEPTTADYYEARGQRDDMVHALREVLDGIPQELNHAYAEGRRDQAEDQPIPDAAIKLLDECMFFCAQAKEPHMDQEDRQGMASGLHDALREYLVDVGHIHLAALSKSSP